MTGSGNKHCRGETVPVVTVEQSTDNRMKHLREDFLESKPGSRRSPPDQASDDTQFDMLPSFFRTEPNRVDTVDSGLQLV